MVDLKLDAFLAIGKEIPRQEIIAKANYQKMWAPQASGNLVPEQLAHTITSLWKERGRSIETIEYSESSDLEGITTETIRYSKGRSDKLRKLALRKANGICAVCNVDFSKILNGKGVRVLQVHHIKQLASYRAPKLTNLSDLAVVCANCHSLIHMNPKKALSIEKLKLTLNK